MKNVDFLSPLSPIAGERGKVNGLARLKEVY